MNFIYILVIAVSVLTVLSAFALLFGSSKSEKGRSLWFFIAAIGEAIWGLSISIFLSLGQGSDPNATAPLLVKGIYAGAVVMDVALLGYISWKYKLGKIVTALFAIAGIAILAVFFYDPSVLYSSINLSGASKPATRRNLLTATGGITANVAGWTVNDADGNVVRKARINLDGTNLTLVLDAGTAIIVK